MNLFLEACGGIRPLYLDIEFQGRHEPVQRILYQPFALIGRESRSDVYLDHPQVSKRHAYLQLIGGRAFCLDLQSRTGTHWEWGPKRSGWLDSQQAVRIGPCWIRIREPEPNGQPAEVQNARAASEPWADQELPEVTLEFVNRAGKSTSWQMAPVLALVGKSPECRVHLVGNSVSRFHCSLIRTPRGVWVIDLLGRGGVAVNDLPVRCSRLDEGDQLQVGKFIIHVHYDTEPIADPRPATEMAANGLQSSVNDISVLSALPQQPKQNPTEVLAPYYPEPADELGPDNDLAVAEPALAAEVIPPAQAEQARVPVHSSGGDLVLAPVQPSLSQAELTQAIMIPVARQLGLMQQQMFDQFQQAMMMMFQMFNTLQRDQVGLISEELQHLRELSEEVHALQVELAKRTQPAPPQAEVAPVVPPASGPSRPSSKPPFEGPLPVTPRPDPAQGASSTEEPSGRLSTSEPSERPQPGVAAPGAPPPSGQPASQPEPPSPLPPKPYKHPRPASEPAAPTVAKRVEEPRREPASTEPAAGAKRVAIPQGKTDAEIQAWLNERIMAIQQERQTRWQKIVNFMTGKDPAP
jgi:pSer/pThr/pTyr-binding forkhead associated (FHA) protein